MKTLLAISFCFVLAGCSYLPDSVQKWIKETGAIACVTIPGQIQTQTDLKALFVSKGDAKGAENTQKAIDELNKALAYCKSQGS